VSTTLTIGCLELSVGARVEGVEAISIAQHNVMSFEPGRRDLKLRPYVN